MIALGLKWLRNPQCLAMIAIICVCARSAGAQPPAAEKSPTPAPSAKSSARGVQPSTLGNPPTERGGGRGSTPLDGTPAPIKPPPFPFYETPLKIFHLHNIDVEPVLKMLAQLVDPDEIKISAETQTNQIVASGPEGSLQYVQAILMQLDEKGAIKIRDSKATARVHIVWLAAGMPDANSAAPSDELKSIIEDLGRFGMKNVRQVAQLVVRTQSNGSFKASCMPLLEDAPAIFSASGTMSNQQIGEVDNMQEKLSKFVNLRIQISASKQRVPPILTSGSTKTEALDSSTSSQERLFDLGLDTALQNSQYALLAVVPVGKITFALVIKIDAEKP
jgi:hypothetical protein